MAAKNLDITKRVSIPQSELEWRFTPSGGPGGQHANRSATRAEVTFDIEASEALDPAVRERLVAAFGPRLRISVDDTRSQTRNRDLALERLRERLAGALRPRRVRRATKPSRGANERRLRAKRKTARRKADRKYRPDD